MWIRSQDKRGFYNPKEILIYGEDIIKVNNLSFGTYKSHDRCIKILDDIQEKMFNCDKNYVYEMPSE
jgi:hypothetical protein